MLYGLDGVDGLKGGGGADGLDGGAGDDILKGGGGADNLAGGSGIDTADYSQIPRTSWHTGGIVINLRDNRGQFGEAEGDRFSGIENVTGSAYTDSLYGNDGASVLKGLDGNDYLSGLDGDDLLIGGNGNDILTGEFGADVLIGEAGNDTYWMFDSGDVINEVAEQGHDTVRAVTGYGLTSCVLPADADIEVMQVSHAAGTARIDMGGNAVAQS